MFFIHFFQTCFIYMAMGSLDLTTVALVPGKMVMRQKLDMILFKTVQWSLERTRKFEKEGVIMRIVMKRKITTEMMTTYFPSILLTMITFATTFFKPFFFEAALSVNLTTMLVMTTIFISKMEVLPSTSDIKMIDIWLVLCQMVPFAEVVLLTAMEYQRKDEDLDHQDEDEDDSDKYQCRNCWRPSLKTIGNNQILLCILLWYW